MTPVRSAFRQARALDRRHLLGLGALLGGAAVTGCGAWPPWAGSSGGGRGSLKVLNSNWGQLYNDAMKRIGATYHDSHPDTTIDWTFTENWQTKLLTQIGANSPPDATYTNWTAQASLAADQNFLNLDGYLAEAGIHADDFIASMYKACLWDNHVQAIPGGADFIVLFWSKDLYRKAGLDPEAPPTTAAELIEHSKQILRRNSRGDITTIGYSPTSDNFIQWAYLFGGQFYDADRRKVTANHPANVEALTWMLDYVKLLDVNKLAAFSELPDYSSPGNPFAREKSAYLLTGFWAYDALDKYAPELDYGITYWPTLHGREAERADYLIQGWMYAIPHNSKNREAAWNFIKFAFIDQAAQMGYKTLNGPCYLKALPDFLAGLRRTVGPHNRIAPYLDVFTETGRRGTRYWPVMRANSYYYDQITQAYDFVTRGRTSPKDALDQVTERVQAKLEAGS